MFRASITEWTGLISALVQLAWPLILAIVVWRLFPAIRRVVETRSFSLKVAGMEVSVQDAAEQMSARIEDLQQQVLALREGVARPGNEADTISTRLAKAAAGAAGEKVIVWVDDKPRGNAFEIAHLNNLGVRVITCLTTAEALETIQKQGEVGAVVSDMGRLEGGEYRGRAGIELLSALRKAGSDVPFMVYTTAKYANRRNSEIVEAGGAGAISSQVDLLDWLQKQLGVAAR